MKNTAFFTGSQCIDEVLHVISEKLNDKESERLLRNLGIEDDPESTLAEKLETVPWVHLKRELEMLGKRDLVEQIQQNTLITKGKIITVS